MSHESKKRPLQGTRPEAKEEVNDDAEPWLQWPPELPSRAEFRACEAYKKIHDEDFLRAMRAELRLKALEACRKALGSEGALVLMGGKESDFELYDSDTLKCEFRQEAYFQYLFGLNEPDCFAIIDLNSGQEVLFVPDVSEDAVRWNGAAKSLGSYVKRYGVHSAVRDDGTGAAVATELKARKVDTIFTLCGLNTDSGATTRTTAAFPGMEAFKVDAEQLHPVLSEARVIKTDKEIEILRLANHISNQAHVYVMRHIKPGMTELQCEALFKAWTGYCGGVRHMAYTCICGSGGNASILHYGHAARPNDKVLKDGDIMLLDMGAEYEGYATDTTRSYPINGTFSADQTMVYEAVRAAQNAVFDALKPGVLWTDMHKLSERVILQHLLKGGLVKGDVDAMMQANLCSMFMPHGLGHFIGLNVHDVGGYPAKGEKKDTDTPGLKWLRTNRVVEQGMVLTVEPGCYFNTNYIESCLKKPEWAKFVVPEVLNRFIGTGGCRLEDDVVVTATGCENMTILPTTVAQVEAVVKGGK